MPVSILTQAKLVSNLVPGLRLGLAGSHPRRPRLYPEVLHEEAFQGYRVL